jgi:beta-fructofuranosidase
MDRRYFLASSLAASVACALEGGLSPAQSADSGGQLPAALRDKLRNDPFRPQFHLLPRANWMNDPCAPRFHRGQYHMFFQYNPNAAVWGDMHWNHAVSPDLIHWKHLPVAIAPTPGSFDAFGIFTGSVLPGMEVPSVLYTGVARSPDETIRGEGLREVQCLATATDPELRTWKKLDQPVIAAPPAGVKVTGFRDPCPWKDGDTWYLIVGSGFEKVGGAVLLYRSSDGHNWEYLHPLTQGTWNESTKTNPVDTGEMWECPDFFPLGDKHVLLYSTERKVYWQVGELDKRELKFHAETSGLLDHGYYYAMKSMVDEKGRRILWGWVEESRTDAELKAAGWAGCMALPRVLTLGPDNRLRMQVPPEFASLRRSGKAVNSPPAKVIAALPRIMVIPNRSAEIVCTFKSGTGPGLLELRADTATLLAIKYNGDKRNPIIDIGGKALLGSLNKEGTSTLHLWMDGSVIEVFLDDREAMTARSYTAGPNDVHLVWTGSGETLHSLVVYGIAAISDDRLTT